LLRYKLLLGVSPNLEDLADEFPEDYEQVPTVASRGLSSSSAAYLVQASAAVTRVQLSRISAMSDADQDIALGALLEDEDSRRHFTTSSKLQKLKESIDSAAEVNKSFIPIRDKFKEKHPSM
jgi:hypothetical protein